MLYAFNGGADGRNPGARLIDVKGMLYGTTLSGGMYGLGTVFSVTPSGSEKVVYAFKGGSDGNTPAAGLININGTLYGTTWTGGGTGCSGAGCGTVFSVTADGIETVLHAFTSGSDGGASYAGLINVNGTMYGTTLYGGGTGCGGDGCGTVFSVTPNGIEKVLYAFKGDRDGDDPVASLININATLYGTTILGGGSRCHGNGCGTVFSLTQSGTERVLYSFRGGSHNGVRHDGARPYAVLTDVDGILYGTTEQGGAFNRGTVFSLTQSGVENVLHSFDGAKADGANPVAGLINVKGTLYGTTAHGGVYGQGTVFAITP